MDVNFPAPLAVTCNEVSEVMQNLPLDDKHWYLGGTRSLAAAVNLLRNGEVIALPTDTIYGFAGVAQNTKSIEKLYELKGRDRSKPFAICLSSIREIKYWADIVDIPPKLITSLLPGPVTIVLKRKPILNPSLNPGFESVGIRVPVSKLVRTLVKRLNEPIALTSANSSNEPSSLEPGEFSHLWPKLGGIFYESPNKKMLIEERRVGSTIVDLVTPHKYKIIRHGIDVKNTVMKLQRHGLQECDPEQT